MVATLLTPAAFGLLCESEKRFIVWRVPVTVHSPLPGMYCACAGEIVTFWLTHWFRS